MVEPFSVAYSATVGADGIDASDAVAVIGGGPIGLLCAMAAVANNAAVAIDRASGRIARSKALEIGARVALDPTAPGFRRGRSPRRRSGRGFDVVIEAAGVAGRDGAGASRSPAWAPASCYVGIDIGAKAPAQIGLSSRRRSGSAESSARSASGRA